MASTRIMRENANAHQKIDSTMAMGGTSHSGSVSSQPAANAADTQTAFHTLTAVAFLPCRLTPARNRQAQDARHGQQDGHRDDRDQIDLEREQPHRKHPVLGAVHEVPARRLGGQPSVQRRPEQIQQQEGADECNQERQQHREQHARVALGDERALERLAHADGAGPYGGQAAVAGAGGLSAQSGHGCGKRGWTSQV
ncbi:hypothetical protein G6F35_014923 [Rhizopus arrhizus]|nr:hypothetical protein G6F35_014923 [Rhizopus arrhizus]